MTLHLHDEIKRVAHAIISEYVRSYPADPHTDVLAKFIDRLEFTVMKLRRIEGVPLRAIGAIQAQEEAPTEGFQGGDPNISIPPPNAPQTAIPNEAPAGGVQTSGWMDSLK
jgi:hypothetical protein